MEASIAAPRRRRDTDRLPGWTPWRRLAVLSLLAAVVADVALMAVHSEIVPPLVGFGVVGVIGAVLLPRGGRSGPVLVGLAGLVPLVVGAPFYLPGLAHPASPVDFLHGTATLLFRGVALGSAIVVLRGTTDRGARRTGIALAAAAATTLAVSTIAVLTISSDVARAGDMPIGAEDSRWTEERIAVAAGGGVVVDNADAFRHTFTLESTGLDVELPANTTRRIVLDVEPGVYTLRCAVPGHERMLAEVEVG